MFEVSFSAKRKTTIFNYGFNLEEAVTLLYYKTEIFMEIYEHYTR